MIAHVAGLPFEETIPQLAPLAVGAVLAVRLLPERARSWARALRTAVLGTLLVASTALVWSASALADPGGKSAATITGSFSDQCRDFTTHSSKDVSHVELHYADGRVVKDEAITSPDYAVDGAAGDELDAAVVKSGTTTATFACAATKSPPTAVLEIQSPPLSNCTLFPFPQYPTCLATESRTVWSSPPDGELLFIFVPPFDPESLPFGFRGTSSTDPDDDIASWSLDFGDGATASGSWSTEPPAEIVHAFGSSLFGPTFTTVTLTVTDAAGQSDSDTINLGAIDGTPD